MRIGCGHTNLLGGERGRSGRRSAWYILDDDTVERGQRTEAGAGRICMQIYRRMEREEKWGGDDELGRRVLATHRHRPDKSLSSEQMGGALPSRGSLHPALLSPRWTSIHPALRLRLRPTAAPAVPAPPLEPL